MCLQLLSILMENLYSKQLWCVQLHQSKHSHAVGTEHLVVDSTGMGSPPSLARLAALQAAVMSPAGAGGEHPEDMESLFQGWMTPQTSPESASLAGPWPSSAPFIRPRAVEGPPASPNRLL